MKCANLVICDLYYNLMSVPSTAKDDYRICVSFRIDFISSNIMWIARLSG